jgi:hypothetical protein
MLWCCLLQQLEDNVIGQPDPDFTELHHPFKEVTNLDPVAAWSVNSIGVSAATSSSVASKRDYPLPSLSSGPATKRDPDHRLVCPHFCGEKTEEPAKFPTLLARGIGEPMALAAPEIAATGRQVELRNPTRRTAISARERANEPPSETAIGGLRCHQLDAVVDCLSPRMVVETKPCGHRVHKVRLVAYGGVRFLLALAGSSPTSHTSEHRGQATFAGRAWRRSK